MNKFNKPYACFLIITPLLLISCKKNVERSHSFGNDGLPSEEVVAFKKFEKSFNYRNSSIEYNSDGCAVYEGIAEDGIRKQRMLLDEKNKPFCFKK